MRLLKLRERGDTIVEVLISIAVVSLVLTVSYETTSHNTRAIQDAQERGQALQLAQRQVEFLKADDAAAIVSPGGTYCYDRNGVGKTADHGHLVSDPCTLSLKGTPVGSSGLQPAYVVSVSGSKTTAFTVQLSWDSITSDGKDNLTLYYKP